MEDNIPEQFKNDPNAPFNHVEEEIKDAPEPIDDDTWLDQAVEDQLMEQLDRHDGDEIE